MQNDKWPTEYARVRDELSELKDKRVVRPWASRATTSARSRSRPRHPWVDVIFARINHKGGDEYSCDAPADEVAAVLKTARQNGKAVVGMKIFGAGKLIKPEEKAGFAQVRVPPTSWWMPSPWACSSPRKSTTR